MSKVIKKARKREKAIMKLRAEGYTFQAIADILKVSRQRVFFLYTRAKKREKTKCGQNVDKRGVDK